MLIGKDKYGLGCRHVQTYMQVVGGTQLSGLRPVFYFVVHHLITLSQVFAADPSIAHVQVCVYVFRKRSNWIYWIRSRCMVPTNNEQTLIDTTQLLSLDHALAPFCLQ